MSKNLRKILVLILSLALAVSMIACTSDDNGATDEEAEGIYTPGTYEASADGYAATEGDGIPVQVEVEFDADKILSVKVVDHEETEGIGSNAVDQLPDEIVEEQSLDVDTVSGATYTSNAILEAVEDAVVQAGGDVESLKSSEDKDEAEKTEEEMETDVVVIGAGGTGLAAAASAYENGADVIIIEKLGITGGSTALSGGAISAPGSRFQEELGIEDSKEDWIELWKMRQASEEEAMYPDYDRVDKFIDEAVVSTHWLADYVGLEYESVDGFGFDPVKRLHTPENGGAGITNTIEDFINKEGIEVITETSATELITDDNGDVVGIMAEGKDGNIKINAKKVIIASGGFAKNEELLERLIPEMDDTAELSAASAGSMGDGILMAEDIGAELYEEPWVIGLGYTSRIPELRAFDWDSTKVLVNEKGERFMNESSHYAIVTNKVAEQEQAWMILDSSEGNAEVNEAIESMLPNEELASGETLEELAAAMDVDKEVLTKTVETFNAGAESGQDEFEKPAEMLVAISEGPYYAFKVYPRTMGTFGGVKTDDKYRVLKEDGSIINNLYAGGEASNKILYNDVYMTGSSVQLAITSGRVAGEDAAKSIE